MKNGTKDLHFSCPVSLLYLIQENVTVKASWCDKFCNEPTYPLYLIDLSRNWIKLQSMSLCLKPWLFPQPHSVLEACLTAFLKHAALSQISCPISYLALIHWKSDLPYLYSGGQGKGGFGTNDWRMRQYFMCWSKPSVCVHTNTEE